jgi:hypothetical protein
MPLTVLAVAVTRKGSVLNFRAFAAVIIECYAGF